MVGSDFDYSNGLSRAVFEPPSERMLALKIAIKTLDSAGRDSESSAAILARQFIAALDLIEKLGNDLARARRPDQDADGRRI